ncbi:MAG: tyrosine-type recombinase/integrase [Rhizobiaceae bacterium]|nr:tyrosine-type recombinase/integrase [Rhizobiaceae bacterium]
MMLAMDYPHLQKRGKNEWRYRRKVPLALRPVLGKLEIVRRLGSTEKEAIKAHPKVHQEVERLFAEAKNPKKAAESVPAPMSSLEAFQDAQRHLRSLQLDPEWTPGEEDDQEWIARDVIADQIAKAYPVDDEGHPVGVSVSDAALLRGLAHGGRQKRPEPTLEDARKLYLKDKVRGDRKKELELTRIFKHVDDAIGSERKLTTIWRNDARELIDYMRDGREASTVTRYLNTVRAMFAHALNEYDLNHKNPFLKLEVEARDKAEPDRRKKRSYTDAELAACRERVIQFARSDLRYVWRIMQGTGCRLAEVTGLRVVDVALDHPIPHIDVEWHDERRVKTSVSRRKVPLLGDALVAAQEAVKAAEGQPLLFPAYCREGGASSASAALGKHVRHCVMDKKIAPAHSIRHWMKDRLRLASVPKNEQDIILGHSSGNVGEDYGGEEVRLEVAKRALEKALA